MFLGASSGPATSGTRGRRTPANYLWTTRLAPGLVAFVLSLVAFNGNLVKKERTGTDRTPEFRLKKLKRHNRQNTKTRGPEPWVLEDFRSALYLLIGMS